MIISFNTGKVETKGGSTGLLQQKKVTVTENGMDVIVPDAGYDGLSTVYVKTYVSEPAEMKDFSMIGYDDYYCAEANEILNNIIAECKPIYDNWKTSNTSAAGLFQDTYSVFYPPLLDTSNVTDMSNMFNRCYSVMMIPAYKTNNVTNMSNMFSYCKNLTSLDLSGWDTSKVTNMNNMFASCGLLTSINGIENWNTSNVTDMGDMFYYCELLTSLDLSGWDTSKVTDIRNLFTGCANLTTVDMTDWDMSNLKSSLTSVYSPFYSTSKLNNIKFGKNLKLSIDINDHTLAKSVAVNILNGLYDFVGNGETPTSSQGKIKFNYYTTSNLSDSDKAIATNKGWTIA